MVTERNEELISLGRHWRIVTLTRRVFGKSVWLQHGRYRWQQCWNGLRLLFHVEYEEPHKNVAAAKASREGWERNKQ